MVTLAAQELAFDGSKNNWWVAVIFEPLKLVSGGREVRENFANRLTPEERDQTERMVRAGKSSARVTTRDSILLSIPTSVGRRPR